MTKTVPRFLYDLPPAFLAGIKKTYFRKLTVLGASKKIGDSLPQQATSASSAGTPNYALETSLVESTPSEQDTVLYTSLAMEEKDDNDVLWYPLLISYSNPKKAKRIRNALTKKGLTTYLRLYYRQAIINQELTDVAIPALSNLIFVKAQKKVIRYLKNQDADLQSLQFMTKPKRDKHEKTTIITIHDGDMEAFISAEIRPDPNRQRKILDYKDYIDKKGRRVLIIRGPFAGIEGEIKHISGHRVIVVKLKDLGLAVGITYVKAADMCLLDE